MAKPNHLFMAIFTAATFASVSVDAQQTTSNLGATLLATPEIAAKIGLHKLDPSERENLKILLDLIYENGLQAALGKKATRAPSKRKLTQPSARRPRPATKAFRAKIDSDDGDILKLSNGAIVEISSGYLGYVGYQKEAVLYMGGGRWKVWIEGKHSFPCEVLRDADYSSAITVERVYVSDVKADGQILSLLDGSLFEVDSLDTISTGLWIGMFDALLIDGSQLLNLDQDGELIHVTRLR